jgi:hypothetical protein
MELLCPNFVIGTLKIGSVEGASCVNFGNNLPTGFESYKKQNQGFGTISGDQNDIMGIKSKLSDSNLIDMINQASPEDVPDWIKELIAEKVAEEEQKVIDEYDDF